MFTQFKDYINKSSIPMVVGVGVGGLSGAVSAVSAVYNSNLRNVEQCQITDFESMLSAEKVGILAGASTGMLLGLTFPATQMFFTWVNNTRYRVQNYLNRNNEAVELINNQRPEV